MKIISPIQKGSYQYTIFTTGNFISTVKCKATGKMRMWGRADLQILWT